MILLERATRAAGAARAGHLVVEVAVRRAAGGGSRERLALRAKASFVEVRRPRRAGARGARGARGRGGAGARGARGVWAEAGRRRTGGGAP